ncbi:porin [Marichromatium purpuratum]|uniref:porin n=1 Tax=Marichromatium purpuratum TaxID=37487 RepID=UPI00021E6F4D|nr:porin [Marichromatium purpuratum]
MRAASVGGVMVALCWLSSAAWASEPALQLHGFASQALIWTSDNRFYGDSPDVSLDFTELGLNGSWRADPRLLLAAQVLVRRAGEMSDATPWLDYALADATLVSTPAYRLGVRMGRIKNPVGLYNETRDVPFTRPGIFLPQVVYFDRVRNMMLASDGLMVYGERYTDLGTFSATLGAGLPLLDANVEWNYLLDDHDGELEPEHPVPLLSLWYADPAERLRLGLSGAAMHSRFDSGSEAAIDAGNLDIRYWLASAQYNAANWTLAGEYAHILIDWRHFRPEADRHHAIQTGWYLQAAYRLSPAIELMLRYEEGDADRRLGDLHLHCPASDHSRIWVVGTRWDLGRRLMLRLEYQRHHGGFTLSYRENPPGDGVVEDWDLFAAQISLRF